MARGQAMTCCEGLSGNPTVRLQRHIHDHGDGKESFARQYRHQGKRLTIKIVSLKRQEIARKRPPKQSRARNSFYLIDRGERRVRTPSSAGLRSMAVQTKSDGAAVAAGRVIRSMLIAF
jgi:hypothetical protein